MSQLLIIFTFGLDALLVLFVILNFIHKGGATGVKGSYGGPESASKKEYKYMAADLKFWLKLYGASANVFPDEHGDIRIEIKNTLSESPLVHCKLSRRGGICVYDQLICAAYYRGFDILWQPTFVSVFKYEK